MQKTKTLPDIGGKPVTVYEVKTRDILALLNDKDKRLADAAQELLPKCVSLTQDELLDLYPSEVDEVLAAFEEVNESFFGKIRALGIVDQLKMVAEMIGKSWCAQFAGQFRQAIATPSTTDGARS